MDLYNQDCFEAFKNIKDGTIDLFLLDLPYGQTSCKWDIMIDLKEMWVQIKRTLKKEGTIVFFCTTKFGYKIIQSNEKWFRYDLVWKKSRKCGFLSANKMPLRQHEMMYVFKEKGGTYNPQKTEGKTYKHNPNSKDMDTLYGSISQIERKSSTRHPTSVVEFNNPHKAVHRTQKPVDLCEWLIKSYSNEEDTVMDFCMGSGTTGVACKNTNRKFIGVEKDEEIFEIAKKRLE